MGDINHLPHDEDGWLAESQARVAYAVGMKADPRRREAQRSTADLGKGRADRRGREVAEWSEAVGAICMAVSIDGVIWPRGRSARG